MNFVIDALDLQYGEQRQRRLAQDRRRQEAIEERNEIFAIHRQIIIERYGGSITDADA